jgi:malonyl-CoA/methylmalonyl-CoA synthetase
LASTVDHDLAEAPALIGYTSGTTGAPKGAVLTHANLLAGARSVASAWEWTHRDRLLLVLPLFHMHGLGVGVNGTLVTGASAIVLAGFAPDAVFDAVARHEATMFFGVPTMYARLARSKRVTELRALRVAVSGSAPLPPSVWDRIHAESGMAILERYGMTETVMLASNPLQGERRAGTVGLPLPGVELRLGEGDVVEVRGPNVFAGYLARPDATEAAFTADGWFRTGDIGRFDAQGYLSLVGRASELIISGGYNVYPREVEDVLRRHPLIADVAVVGTPDEEWGEIVTAYVVLSPDVHAAAEASSVWSDPVAAFAREELAPHKVPRRWYALDTLPRNAMGKVVRQALQSPQSP